MNTYRLIEKEDNLAVKKLIQAVFEEYDAPREGTVFADPEMEDLHGLFERAEKAVFWLAEEDGNILGCCGVYPTSGLPSGLAELVKLYLDAGARGKGIGKTLMEKCIASAQDMAYEGLYLESIPLFGQAVSLYEKVGFRRLSKPLGDSGHFSCSIWMLKDL
ncbi:N-acetyltransferase [Echinicola pacifica]|uniref:N-acetyltransferase n=1 Tax=Echinicola pacifica TaxID=346377 RepID=A0A918PS57_9BACT|nr:GNAT family N-acetyltransferase [Echinicola pacifica]GGZ21065.1 N-acetyltransferase [Echinicola pacifica]